MAGTVMLEATRERREIWQECRIRQNCRRCKFKYACEEQFPTPGRDWGKPDLLPSDYSLSVDGDVFYTSAV